MLNHDHGLFKLFKKKHFRLYLSGNVCSCKCYFQFSLFIVLLYGFAKNSIDFSNIIVSLAVVIVEGNLNCYRQSQTHLTELEYRLDQCFSIFDGSTAMSYNQCIFFFKCQC